MNAPLNRISTGTLDIAYEESGAANGPPVLLMHGWPYDVHDYDAVVPLLADGGCRVIVPYLRGFGPTRFLSPEPPRSGQQAALGNDLKALMDALGIARAALAGYDWAGARPASWQRYGRHARAAGSPATATKSTPSPPRPHQQIPSRNAATGISIISTLSEAAPA